jgi:hypothetical protein
MRSVSLLLTELAGRVAGLKTRIMTAAASIALLAACSPGSTPQPLPQFALTNQSGHVIRAEDLRGRSGPQACTAVEWSWVPGAMPRFGRPLP